MNTGLAHRARAATASLALARCMFDYNPSQPRAEDGKWSSGAGLLGGIEVLDGDKYWDAYGDDIGEATVEGVGGHDWTVRVFESSDAHLVIDTADLRQQVLKELDGDAMRALATDIQSVLDLDVEDYDDVVDENGAVDGLHNSEHNWAVSLDADGNVRVHPNGDESSEYMDMSEDEGASLAQALERMADLYDEHFGADGQ